MRAIWKGALSFGLVNVPVRVYSATEEHDIRFHQVHRADGGRIRYRRTCSACGDEVSFADIAKGYELPSGEIIVLTDEDFAELPLVTGREIDVVEFVPADQVDPILFAKTYYLEPDPSAAKPYALLREALVGTDRMAIAKVALRQRETLAALRVRDKAILLQTMLWPDEVREASFDVLDQEVELRPQELKMASSLIESMSEDFRPERFTDAYREALETLIEARTQGREAVEAPAERPDSSRVVDLMSALQASVDAARAARGAPADSPAGRAGSGRGKAQARKAAGTGRATRKAASGAPAGKRTPATSSAAKSAAAKTSAAKSTASKSTASRSAASRSARSSGTSKSSRSRRGAA